MKDASVLNTVQCSIPLLNISSFPRAAGTTCIAPANAANHLTRIGEAAATDRDLLPRTCRTILFAGLTTFSLFGAAGPKQDKTYWDNLKQLAPNEQIRIVLNGAKSYRGEFQSVGDDITLVRLAAGVQRFSRESALRVSTRGPSHLGRNALIGAGIGAAAGAAAIARICQTSYCRVLSRLLLG